MKKIPTVWQRDPHQRRFVVPHATPGCEWVLLGEGVPTRKYNGTHVAFDGERWWARREVKGNQKVPDTFVLVERDEVTGHLFGKVPVQESAFYRYVLEALEAGKWSGPPEQAHDWTPGGYELIGPKINGNPEKAPRHMLIKHSEAEVLREDKDVRAFDLQEHAFPTLGWEGVVYHHPDGRMAKLKTRDFPR